jgi:hypothetical protein
VLFVLSDHQIEYYASRLHPVLPLKTLHARFDACDYIPIFPSPKYVHPIDVGLYIIPQSRRSLTQGNNWFVDRPTPLPTLLYFIIMWGLHWSWGKVNV